MFAYSFFSFYYSIIVLVISFNQFNLDCLTLDCFCLYVSLSVLWINKGFKHQSVFLSNGKNKINSLSSVFLSLYVYLKKIGSFFVCLRFFLFVPYLPSVFKMTVCLSDCPCHSFQSISFNQLFKYRTEDSWIIRNWKLLHLETNSKAIIRTLICV
jgi:hypothetical protein